MPVHVELTTRRDQPIDNEQLQYFFPTDRFASFGETFLPEPVQSQLPPQLTCQPTVPEYARPSQLQFAESHLNPIAYTCGNAMVVGKQAHRGVLLPVFVEYGQALSPRFFLLVIDLSQIQHRSLCRATRC